ncbi:hypothetical protein Sj15T_09560 [Sphingobium sp. TA15]|uniref:Uncharacterized protein n=1 Tax=Sphingobium indicum (strain DSM 16413 / CCM 7287 / MTCC 6362 / UT26 / NBRC 101211 / UT26S) TaxID=452662 RepID=D4Z218_SPHIU|nr:hypothetical protein [Sphingobium indicum]BAI96650.1 hypothetical protein SJA_C1-18160 [Sphingobium indicum UT26S]BDD65935.1 hypothetical protein Sj15T_09560 [Sphingobium sp. TA15]
MTDMSMKALLEPYDINLPLRDALEDSTLSPDRRALAAVAFRQEPNDSLYSAVEVLEAFQALEADIEAQLPTDASSEGEARIRHILEGEGDDYQRRLYYILSERPVSQAIRDLEWLTDLLYGRARMVRTLREAGVDLPRFPGVDRGADDDSTGPIGCRPFGC